jgi:hypothetical protein
MAASSSRSGAEPESGGRAVSADASSSGPAESRSSSRAAEWAIVALGLLAALGLLNWRGNVGRPSTTVSAAITLITSDRDNLSCAMDRAVGPYRCAFVTPDRAWPEPVAPSQRLAPYVTVDRKLLLVPGLFEQPALAARYAAEPPEGVPRERLHRFSLRCELRLVERVDRFETRWSRNWPWGPQRGAWVAEPVDCRLE